MKKIAITLLLAALLLTACAQSQPEEPQPETTETTEVTEATEVTEVTEEVDYSAPDFTMTDREGNTVKLSDFEGKPVILNFWASWCGPCKSEMPDIEEAYKEYGGDIHFLIVNLTDGTTETVETASAYIDSMGYTFPVYFDTEMQGAYTYGVSAIPLTYFIDANGDLVTYYRGAMTADILQQGIDLISLPAETE